MLNYERVSNTSILSLNLLRIDGFFIVQAVCLLREMWRCLRCPATQNGRPFDGFAMVTVRWNEKEWGMGKKRDIYIYT